MAKQRPTASTKSPNITDDDANPLGSVRAMIMGMSAPAQQAKDDSQDDEADAFEGLDDVNGGSDDDSDQPASNSQIRAALTLVPTPIGNLDDITLRGIKVLQQASCILAEDTRTAGFLLKHLGIKRPLQSYHIFNEHQTIERLLKRMQAGEQLVLVSDAGTPAISDPGFLLVRATLEAGLSVDCLPGATAFVPALVRSGFPCSSFVFEGFLPVKKGRQTMLNRIQAEDRTVILYESPHRLLKTLQQMIDLMGPDRPCSISRELTKYYEETVNGTLQSVLTYYTQKGVKGEFVIVIGGQQLQS
jgi:16S rRNA (cytidine1402-2'-O)-methyltransferase